MLKNILAVIFLVTLSGCVSTLSEEDQQELNTMKKDIAVIVSKTQDKLESLRDENDDLMLRLGQCTNTVEEALNNYEESLEALIVTASKAKDYKGMLSEALNLLDEKDAQIEFLLKLLKENGIDLEEQLDNPNYI